MKFLKKMKDILFDEEEVAPKKEEQEVKTMVKEPVNAPTPVSVAPKVTYEEPVYEKKTVYEEKKIPHESYRSEASFPFPEFDEDEFERDLTPPKPLRQAVNNRSVLSSRPSSVQSQSFEYERSKKIEKRPEYSRFEKAEIQESKEKRKFKPSPVISPVYGVLNQDYKPEDIKNKEEFKTNSINVDDVRKKAFGELEKLEETLDEPVRNFYEEEKAVNSDYLDFDKKEKVKTIDELLEDTSHIKIDLEEDFELDEEDVIVPNIPATPKERKAPVMDDFEDDTLENDLFDLIDSMYENKEEGEI